MIVKNGLFSERNFGPIKGGICILEIVFELETKRMTEKIIHKINLLLKLLISSI